MNEETKRIRRGPKGNAHSTDCPRGGYVRLTKGSEWITMPTICKTWGCIACRDKVKSRMMERITYGCSIVGTSYFITNTFRRGSKNIVDVDYVRMVWTRYLRILKKRYPNLKWIKVLELTKKKTPHLHTIMAGHGIEEKRICEIEFTNQWYARDCDCIAHNHMVAWREATYGDSYVGDARLVVGARGAAGYLTKYLVKSIMMRKDLEDLGFTRSWASSRNWPRPPESRLLESDWDKVEVIRPINVGEKDALEAQVKKSEGTALTERVDPEYFESKKKMAIKGKIAGLRGNLIEGV